MTDLTPTQKAAAFHGLATNPTIPPQERMALALQALDLYEAEAERLWALVARYVWALDAIEFACDTATDDSLRGGIRSMIRRARVDALTTTEETRTDGCTRCEQYGVPARVADCGPECHEAHTYVTPCVRADRG